MGVLLKSKESIWNTFMCMYVAHVCPCLFWTKKTFKGESHWDSFILTAKQSFVFLYIFDLTDVFFKNINSFIELQFTYHTIYPFKVYNSVVFSVFTVVQPSPQSILEHFPHLKKRNMCFVTKWSQRGWNQCAGWYHCFPIMMFIDPCSV